MPTGSSGSKNAKLTWHEPRWAYLLRLRKQLDFISNRRSPLRIVLIVLVVAVVILTGMQWVAPQMAIPHFWRIVFVLPAIGIALALRLAVFIWIPAVVAIRPDTIIHQHGRFVTVVDSTTVKATFLTSHADDRIRLRICYVQNAKHESLVAGVPPTASLDRLTELLPVAPAIRDARGRVPMGKRRSPSGS